MFVKRLISGMLLLIAALVMVITGGNVLLVLLAGISLIGMTELYKVFDIHTKIPGIIGYLGSIGYYLMLFFDLKEYLLALFIVGLILLMGAYVISFPKYKVSQILPAFFGVFYVAVMLSFIYQTRILENGVFSVWLIFICAWGCDTCAYCVGVLIGKHKMAPKLSPKKSIEGAIGGIVGAALLGLVYALLIQKFADAKVSVPGYMIVGALGAVVSQIGDLAASAIKRDYEIKDYGKLIPGHGGILDRFDSIIFIAPIIYYLLLVIGQ